MKRDDATFIEMWNAGTDTDVLAAHFEREPKTIIGWATRLRQRGHDVALRVPRLDASEVKKRKCMGCGKQFRSMHVGNRLCSFCGDHAGRNSHLEGVTR